MDSTSVFYWGIIKSKHFSYIINAMTKIIVALEVAIKHYIIISYSGKFIVCV